MPTVKKIPERLCVGCHEVRQKRDLIRIVRSPVGEFSADISGKKPGRGAYICRNEKCFDNAVKNGQFSRSFKEQVPKDVLMKLRDEIFPPGE